MQPLCRSHDCTQNWGLHVFFAAMLHSQFVPHSVWSQCSKTGSVLAMQPLCRSHGWTVVNHYCTQNRGLKVCFLRQCCTHSLCPTLWPLCPKTGSVLAMQPLCSKSWLDCGKSLLHTKQGSHSVFFAAMLHSLFVPHIVATVPQN